MLDEIEFDFVQFLLEFQQPLLLVIQSFPGGFQVGQPTAAEVADIFGANFQLTAQAVDFAHQAVFNIADLAGETF